MLPIIAGVPAPLDFTLGFSIVGPGLVAVALCCMALLHAVLQQARRRAARPAAPYSWPVAHPSYAGHGAR